MKILVTGANGQLGRCLRDVNKEMSCDELKFYWTDITADAETDKLDICDAKAVKDYIDTYHIDVVVNCAAYTDVDAAEDDFNKAMALNCSAVENIARVINNADGLLIQISTDYVFEGTNCKPYTELDLIDPISIYGLTKYKGELFATAMKKHIVLRTAWLYSEYGKNFVKTMYKLIENCGENDSVSVVADQIGTPTYAYNLAMAIYYIIVNYGLNNLEGKYGVYHFTDLGVASWYDFAYEINGYIRPDTVITPCTTSEFPTRAERPNYSVLDKSKFMKTFPDFGIHHWRSALTKCILNLANEKDN